MKKNNMLSLVSAIRKKGNNLILNELAEAGIKGLVPTHGDILVQLYIQNGLTMNDIAEKINRTNATVTVLVDKLVKLGFVYKEKSKLDRRVSFLNLTEKGENFRGLFFEISKKLNEKLYGSLTDEEAEILETLLEKVKNY